jgi:hypothetical protein
MLYDFELTETLENKLKKLQTKNKVLLIACRKKIYEIIQNPYPFITHKQNVI